MESCCDRKKMALRPALYCSPFWRTPALLIGQCLRLTAFPSDKKNGPYALNSRIDSQRSDIFQPTAFVLFAQQRTVYTLSEAWGGVNWADLMAAQGAFGTDFYDRSTRTIVGTMLWTENKNRSQRRPGQPWDPSNSLRSKPRTEYSDPWDFFLVDFVVPWRTRRSWRRRHRTRTTLRGKNLWPVSFENYHRFLPLVVVS